MKNQIRSISLVALFLIALTTIGAAHANYTATVQNNSPYALGTVQINSDGHAYYVNVPGPGAFPVQVLSQPSFVVVNNFMVAQGQSLIVPLQNGKRVKVTVGGGNIVVQDQSIVQ
ncbi:MAG: hypothetical protein ABI778_10125 [Ignavibacteriota bacterium]